jgi:hydrogenase maturation factor
VNARTVGLLAPGAHLASLLDTQHHARFHHEMRFFEPTIVKDLAHQAVSNLVGVAHDQTRRVLINGLQEEASPSHVQNAVRLDDSYGSIGSFRSIAKV